MKPTLSIFFLGLLCLLSSSVQAQQKIGIFEGDIDIGSNTKPGSATYISQNEQYVITGAGYNVWFDHDEFHYLFKKIKGNFILYTRAKFIGWNGVEQHGQII